MQPAERIPLIKKLAEALASLDDWLERELVLRQFGFTSNDVWNYMGEEGQSLRPHPYEYALYHLETSGSDEALLELERYLDPASGGESPHTADDVPTAAIDLPGPWNGDNTFRLFISHTHHNAPFASVMQEHLEKFLVECFVAHKDIEPSEKWQEVIESALLSCHAVVALVTPDFRDSAWCDQEIGFCLARKLVIVPLTVETDPYGFLGSFQAIKLRNATDRTNAKAAANAAFDILAKRPETQERMTPCIVRRFSASSSYDDTRAAFPPLSRIPREAWTPELVDEVKKATVDNSQVKHASLRTGTPVPEATVKLLESIDPHNSADWGEEAEIWSSNLDEL
jgi:hypothetical protein